MEVRQHVGKWCVKHAAHIQPQVWCVCGPLTRYCPFLHCGQVLENEISLSMELDSRRSLGKL